MAFAASPSGSDRNAADSSAAPIGEVLRALRLRGPGAAGREAVGGEQDADGAVGEAGERLVAGRAQERSLAWPGTKRFCAACLETPMALPIWLQDRPDRRAWSTKYPISASDCWSSCSETANASDTFSSGPPSGCRVFT